MAYQYQDDYKPFAVTGLDLTPSGLGARIGIDRAEREGLLLSDQDYYNKNIRQKELALQQKSDRASQAVGRGARIAQGDFMTSQGLAGSGIAEGAGVGISDAFRPARRRRQETARLKGEDLRRKEFEKRDAKLNEMRTGIGIGHQLESQISSAILSSNPFTAGFAPLAAAGTTAKAIPYTMMPGELVKQRNEAYGRPLETVDYGAGVRGGRDDYLDYGGGGSDFSRLYG
jgi:hypothetical protein